MSHNRYSYDVIENATGKRFPNLVGVFSRVFPTVSWDASKGKTQTVTYYGDAFTLRPREKQATT